MFFTAWLSPLWSPVLFRVTTLRFSHVKRGSRDSTYTLIKLPWMNKACRPTQSNPKNKPLESVYIALIFSYRCSFNSTKILPKQERSRIWRTACQGMEGEKKRRKEHHMSSRFETYLLTLCNIQYVRPDDIDRFIIASYFVPPLCLYCYYLRTII